MFHAATRTTPFTRSLNSVGYPLPLLRSYYPKLLFINRYAPRALARPRPFPPPIRCGDFEASRPASVASRRTARRRDQLLPRQARRATGNGPGARGEAPRRPCDGLRGEAPQGRSARPLPLLPVPRARLHRGVPGRSLGPHRCSRTSTPPWTRSATRARTWPTSRRLPQTTSAASPSSPPRAAARRPSCTSTSGRSGITWTRARTSKRRGASGRRARPQAHPDHAQRGALRAAPRRVRGQRIFVVRLGEALRNPERHVATSRRRRSASSLTT